jgi:cytochrome c556
MPAAEHAGHEAGAPDTRVAVDLPEPLRTHTLANMRDHLAALQEIQQALASGSFDQAAQIAEGRLGMTSLKRHGAHDVAKFIPAGMQSIGTEMHRSASRFSVEASNSGATGDVKASIGALARVTQQCVACHATYRMK